MTFGFLFRFGMAVGNDPHFTIAHVWMQVTPSLQPADTSSHTITADSLAHPRGFEPPTCRLGGGRSILLSYGCICFSIVSKFWSSVNELRHFFSPCGHIMGKSGWGRGTSNGKYRGLWGCGRSHFCWWGVVPKWAVTSCDDPDAQASGFACMQRMINLNLFLLPSLQTAHFRL